MKLEPGMRVRRVRGFYGVFRVGDEDVVTYATGDLVETAQYPGYFFSQRSFKPVFRVKAGRSTAFSTTHVKSAPRHGFSGGSNRATYSSSDLAAYSMRRLRDFAADAHAGVLKTS